MAVLKKVCEQLPDKKRPIYCDELILKVWSVYDWLMARPAMIEFLGYINLGVGAKAGCELGSKMLQMAMQNVHIDELFRNCKLDGIELVPDCGLAIQRREWLARLATLMPLDLKNCFNELERNAMRSTFNAYCEESGHGFLGQINELMTAAPRPYVYDLQGGEVKLRYFEKGMNQGPVNSPICASLVNKERLIRAMDKVIDYEPRLDRNRLFRPSIGTCVSSFIDDFFSLLPFWLQVQLFKSMQSLTDTFGPSLSLSKLRIMPTHAEYSSLTAKDRQWMCTALGIPDAEKEEVNSSVIVPMVVILGCPHAAPARDGSDRKLLEDYVSKVVDTKIDKMRRIANSRVPVEIVDRMIRAQCGQVITHLCRTLPPDLMMPYCKQLDDAVVDIVKGYTGTTRLSVRKQKQLHLPINMAGFGYQSAQIFCHFASYASWAQLAPQLTELRDMYPGTEMPGVEWRAQSVESLRQLGDFKGARYWPEDLGDDDAFWDFYDQLSKEYEARSSSLRLQRILTRKYHRNTFKELLAELAGHRERRVKAESARLLSLCSKGASTWLSQRPSEHRKMSDVHFILSWRRRMGLPLFRTQAKRCRRGCPIYDGSEPNRADLGETCHYHLTTCKALNKTLKNHRHNDIRDRLVGFLRECSCIVSVEQHHWTEDEKDDGKRPDLIWWPLGGAAVITDVKVTCPMAPSNVDNACSAALNMAKTVENTTAAKYDPIKQQLRGSVLTACVETTGAQGLQFRKVMRKASKAWVDSQIEGLDRRSERAKKAKKKAKAQAKLTMLEAWADIAVLLQNWNARTALIEQQKNMSYYQDPGRRGEFVINEEVEELENLPWRLGDY